MNRSLLQEAKWGKEGHTRQRFLKRLVGALCQSAGLGKGKLRRACVTCCRVGAWSIGGGGGGSSERFRSGPDMSK